MASTPPASPPRVAAPPTPSVTTARPRAGVRTAAPWSSSTWVAAGPETVASPASARAPGRSNTKAGHVAGLLRIRDDSRRSWRVREVSDAFCALLARHGAPRRRCGERLGPAQLPARWALHRRGRRLRGARRPAGRDELQPGGDRAPQALAVSARRRPRRPHRQVLELDRG